MQELKNRLPEQLDGKVAEVREVKKQLQLIARITPHKNHTVWECNIKDLTVVEAERKGGHILIAGKATKRQGIITRENCIYIPALNAKNARRKMERIMEGLLAL